MCVCVYVYACIAIAGLYCQVVVDNVNASYTVIPDQIHKHLIHFKIRKCTLTEKFRKMVRRISKAIMMLLMLMIMMMMKSIYWRLYRSRAI